MTESAILVRNLRKTFGDHVALGGIDLTVPRGSIYGFIGANGAGKTTTIRILLGLAQKDSGQVEILGHNRGMLPEKPLSGVAYLPDVPAVYPWLRPTDALIMLAEMSGVKADIAKERAADLLSLVGLNRARGKVGQFSRGMKQRLGMAAALVGAPELLVLDEPTSALDPMGRRDVLNLLKELRGQTTVLFSTHLLGDVQEVSTHVGMIDAGKMVAEGSLEEVLDLSNRKPSYELQFPQSNLATIQAALKACDLSLEIKEQRASLQEVYEQLSDGHTKQAASAEQTNLSRQGNHQ